MFQLEHLVVDLFAHASVQNVIQDVQDGTASPASRKGNEPREPLLRLYVLGDHLKTVSDSGTDQRISLSFVQGGQNTLEVELLLNQSHIAEGERGCPADQVIWMLQKSEAVLLRPAPIFFVPGSTVKRRSYLLWVVTLNTIHRLLP
jgi:hypothetical protein